MFLSRFLMLTSAACVSPIASLFHVYPLSQVSVLLVPFCPFSGVSLSLRIMITVIMMTVIMTMMMKEEGGDNDDDNDGEDACDDDADDDDLTNIFGSSGRRSTPSGDLFPRASCAL